MPIVRTPDLQQMPPPTSCGVILFRIDPATGDIEGTFALAQYKGQLAREIGQKTEGTPGDFAGKYDVTTLRPDGTKFAEGRMSAWPLGDQGAYKVIWELYPVEDALRELGYVPGTRLLYEAIGLKLGDGAEVSVAWDNDVFARHWPEEPAQPSKPGSGLSQAT